MAQNDLLLRRCRKLAGEDPPQALVLLWRSLRQHGNLEQGLDRQKCEQQAEAALQALEEGRELPRVHPAAALRAIDGYLALLDSGQQPRAWRMVTHDTEGDFFLVPRRAGWTSRFAAAQPGHLEYWMRHYQVVPTVHRGITIEIGSPPYLLSKPGTHLSFSVGGFDDGVFPGWNKESPYRCHRLADPQTRWRSVEKLLADAAQQGAVLVVLPELTVDRYVRERLVAWLREQRPPFALVVAGSFHEDESPEGTGPRRNVAHVFDGYGDEVLRQVKLRPMRAMPKDQVADEEIEGGSSVRLLHAWFGLLAIAICLDFCESGDAAVTDLWRAVGPSLVLVPSMGGDRTNNAHREKAGPLARQHGTTILVASQHHEKPEALGLFWDANSLEAVAHPVLHSAVSWTKN